MNEVEMEEVGVVELSVGEFAESVEREVQDSVDRELLTQNRSDECLLSI